MLRWKLKTTRDNGKVRNTGGIRGGGGGGDDGGQGGHIPIPFAIFIKVDEDVPDF
jgi:hypothetical protein